MTLRNTSSQRKDSDGTNRPSFPDISVIVLNVSKSYEYLGTTQSKAILCHAKAISDITIPRRLGLR